MIYWQLFLAFFRVGIFGYGGGPSMIPLVHAECVKKYKWISSDEFSDYYAFANTLPGPIATKMAAYVGYRQKGWLGAIIANIAVFLPVVLLMIGLLEAIGQFKESSKFTGMVHAIQPVIGVMMLALTWEFLSKGWKATQGKVGFSALVIISVLTLAIVDLHPGILIAVFLAGAFIYSTWFSKRESIGKKRGAQQR